jgi:recombination protein RecA
MARPKKSSMDNDELTNIDIDKILTGIDKKFGKGSVFKLSEDMASTYDKGAISTGLLGLDQILGVGGFPRGRIIEAYGPTGGGKTTLAIKAAAQAQKAGDALFIIDAEHSLDFDLVVKTGIKDNSTCFLSQPDSGEEALDLVEYILRSGLKSYIVIDSIAALVPQSEINKGFTDAAQPGVQARLIASALRKLTPIIHKSNSVLLCINQIRNTIGTMGSKTTTPGGNALKFWASVRMNIKNVAQILDGDKAKIGHTTRIRIEKNKVSIPFKEADITLIYGSGLSSTSDILNHAIAQGIVKKSGAWYSYGEERVAQGELNAIKAMYNTPDWFIPIRNQVCANLGVEVTHDDMYCDKYLAIADKEDIQEIKVSPDGILSDLIVPTIEEED